MTIQFEDARAKSFRANYELWIALSHFLPAQLIQELAVALIPAASRGRLQFEDLCEAHVSSGHSSLASWNVRFKPGKQGLDRFLQRVVRGLVWQNDSLISLQDGEIDPKDLEVARSLEFSFSLARADMAMIDVLAREQRERKTCLDIMFSAMCSLRTAVSKIGDATLIRIEEITAGLEPPLRVILLKHLGDLCADVDQPTAATRIYDAADSAYTVADLAPWEDLFSPLRAIILQSRAAMLWLADGPTVAAKLLSAGLDQAPFMNAPLLLTNSASDVMSAHWCAGEGNFEDIRPALLIAPQLVVSHDLGTAFRYWDAEKYNEAHRHFWATLRRQIALGATLAARETKAYYGRSILDELSKSIGKQRETDAFSMAMRLLTESGKPDIIEQHDWSADLLEVYLTTHAVELVVQHADHAPGARDERRLALIAIARGWLLNLPSEAAEIASNLLAVLSQSAREWPSSVGRGPNIAQAALKALENVALKRPDLRHLGSNPFTNAILATLALDDFRANWAALDATAAFAGGLHTADLRRCITAALDVLDKIQPSVGPWPVVDPALSIISSPRAQQLWTQDDGLGRRCATTILSFGLQSENEGTRLLFLLKDIGPYIDPLSLDAKNLADRIVEVRRQARVINSTAVTSAIMALLAAPAVAGIDGIRDAIEGLEEILRSAQTQGPSIGLSLAYKPIIQLYEEKDRIAQGLNITTEETLDLMRPIIDPLAEFWFTTATKPQLFATFSIPKRTAPDPILVHNWAFSTIGFARAVNATDRLSAALQRASENSLIGPHVELAHAVRLTAGDPEPFDVQAIRAESLAPFYAALGQRLVLLTAVSKPDRSQILEALFHQCLRHGPNGLDASVFALAIEAGVNFSTDLAVRENYAMRLRNNPKLYPALMPLLRASLRKLSE